MKEKITDIIVNILISLFGLFLLIWADSVTNMISIILGIAIIFYGASKLIDYFRFQESSFVLVFAICSLVFGAFLIYRADFLKELISFIIGLYIIIASLASLTTILKIQGSINKKYNTALILSIIGLILGFLCIIGKFIIPDFLLRFVGAIIMCYGIINVINAFLIDKPVYMKKS